MFFFLFVFYIYALEIKKNITTLGILSTSTWERKWVTEQYILEQTQEFEITGCTADQHEQWRKPASAKAQQSGSSPFIKWFLASY